MSKSVVSEISESCLLTRTRQISRVLTSIYDGELRGVGIKSPQLSLLVLIGREGPVTRAAIGRQNHQERSTLTRNLKRLIAQGWVEEDEQGSSGRSRPIKLSAAGAVLLREAVPAWRRAQAKAKNVLGEAGIATVFSVADDLSS